MLKMGKIHKKIYKNIIKKIETDKMTQKNIAIKAKMSETTLSRSLKALENGAGINTNTLFNITTALNINLQELFK